MHIYSASDCYPHVPILLVNGGVDTWKMDFHSLHVGMAQRLGMTVIGVRIIGNDIGFDLEPSADASAVAAAKLSRRYLLDRPTNAARLVMEVLFYIASWLPKWMRA